MPKDSTRPLSTHLEENLTVFDEMFGSSADFYAKRITVRGCDGAILLFDNLTSLEMLWTLVLESICRGTVFADAARCRAQADTATAAPCAAAAKRLTGPQIIDALLGGSDIPAESTPAADFDTCVQKLTGGLALLLFDGCGKAAVFSIQSMKQRGVDEPSAEGNLRGSREGFSDLLRTNLSLLRRLVRTEDLVLETAFARTATGTEYALCYRRDKASPEMVAQLRTRLAAADPPVLLDSSYFVPWLCPVRRRLFTPVGYTERPAVAAAKLCEGKLLVLVNGSPSAMILPYLFSENFDCLDDYGGTAYFASFLRLLKYFSFYLTILLPGVFVAAALWQPELIPPTLLYKIAAAEKATPLPLFAEMLAVILVLEVIREAGLRMPQSLGHSVSLVAALIVGDAAVSTGILSTTVIIVASVTSIAMFLVPSLYEPAAMLRVLFLLAGGVAGPAGIAFGLVALCASLSGLAVLGVPYTAVLLPFTRAALRDGVIRRNYRVLARADREKDAGEIK